MAPHPRYIGTPGTWRVVQPRNPQHRRQVVADGPAGRVPVAVCVGPRAQQDVQIVANAKALMGATLALIDAWAESPVDLDREDDAILRVMEIVRKMGGLDERRT